MAPCPHLHTRAVQRYDYGRHWIATRCLDCGEAIRFVEYPSDRYLEPKIRW